MPKGRPVGAKTQKPDAKPTHRRFTPAERQILKAKVAELDMQGYNYGLIAKKVEVSLATVSNFLQEIQNDYQQAYIDNRKALVMKETAVLLDVRRRAYEEMDLLKERGRVRTIRESGESEKGAWSKDGETREDVDISGYLAVILNTEQRIAKLWGLEELPKVTFIVNNNSGNQTTVNIFDQLLQTMLGQGPLISGTDNGQATGADPLPITGSPPAIRVHSEDARRDEDGGPAPAP